MGRKKARTDAERGTHGVSDGEFPLLASLGLYASNTTGDGNCLFRALSDQLYGDESHCREIRSGSVGYIKAHPDRFAAFVGEFGESFDMYTKRLMQDAVYGGHLEVVAAAEHYAADIAIYQADQMYIVQPIEAVANKTLHIAYHTWEHYSSVRNKGGPHSGPPQVSAKSGPVPIAKEEVPRWKVEIVMRSCPEAEEQTIISKLKTKDYGQVIEELLTEPEHQSDHQPITEPSIEAGPTVKEERTAEAGRPKKRQSAREKRDQARKKALERKLNKNKRRSEPAVPDQASEPAVNLPDKTIYI